MTKRDRKIALLMSDSHAWFDLGLLNPLCLEKIPDVAINPDQYKLWNIFEWGIQQVTDLAGKDDIFALHMGDISQGNKRYDDLTNAKLSPQIISATYNFYPILALPNLKALRIAGGTYAHNFGNNSAEEMVEFILQEKFPKKDIKLVKHGLLNLGGVGIDYAHHGPHPGMYKWTRGNVARAYIRNYQEIELDSGNVPANILLRGHFHTFVKEWAMASRMGIDYETWLIVMPPLSLISGYAQQSTRSGFVVTPGIVALEIIDGNIYKIHKFTEALDHREKESF